MRKAQTTVEILVILAIFILTMALFLSLFFDMSFFTEYASFQSSSFYWQNTDIQILEYAIIPPQFYLRVKNDLSQPIILQNITIDGSLIIVDNISFYPQEEKVLNLTHEIDFFEVFISFGYENLRGDSFTMVGQRPLEVRI